MNTYERSEVRHYYLPYVIAQALGYVLVAALTITDSEIGVRDIVEGIICSPAIALLFRFAVYLYRVIRMYFGRIISLLGAFIGTTCIFTAIVRIVYVSPISTYATIALASLVSIYILCLDIKTLVAGERAANGKRKGIIITISAVLLCMVITTCLVALLRGKYNKPENNEATMVETLSEDSVDADCFDPPCPVLANLCEKSLAMSNDQERDDIEDGYEVPVKSAVKAAYYLKTVDLSYPHIDGWHNIAVNNAVMIVTSYRVKNSTGFTFDREEWNEWVYPNFTVGADGTLTYDTESEHSFYLSGDSLEDISKWLEKEYADMNITKLMLPS